jgi:5-methylcytosine-specific restriction endonuclease McrA
MNSTSKILKRKKNIPKALREQVWILTFGKTFENKCKIKWCNNTINVFDFQCGHNIPESKGGKTIVENLIPLCSRCNQSMNNIYTIDEWNLFGETKNQDENYSETCCIIM